LYTQFRRLDIYTDSPFRANTRYRFFADDPDIDPEVAASLVEITMNHKRGYVERHFRFVVSERSTGRIIGVAHISEAPELAGRQTLAYPWIGPRALLIHRKGYMRRGITLALLSGATRRWKSSHKITSGAGPMYDFLEKDPRLRVIREGNSYVLETAPESPIPWKGIADFISALRQANVDDDSILRIFRFEPWIQTSQPKTLKEFEGLLLSSIGQSLIAVPKAGKIWIRPSAPAEVPMGMVYNSDAFRRAERIVHKIRAFRLFLRSSGDPSVLRNLEQRIQRCELRLMDLAGKEATKRERLYHEPILQTMNLIAENLLPFGLSAAEPLDSVRRMARVKYLKAHTPRVLVMTPDGPRLVSTTIEHLRYLGWLFDEMERASVKAYKQARRQGLTGREAIQQGLNAAQLVHAAANYLNFVHRTGKPMGMGSPDLPAPSAAPTAGPATIGHSGAQDNFPRQSS